MYCKMCGKELEGNKDICIDCEAKENTSTLQDENVEVIKEVKDSNNKENAEQNNKGFVNNEYKGKSKLAAGLFGIFLGTFGVHNFYLGYVGKAIAQLLITILSCGFLSFVSAIWGLIEGILILTGDINKDANNMPLRD